MRISYLVLLVTLSVLMGCKSQKNGSNKVVTGKATDIQWTKVTYGTYSAIEEENQQIIQTTADWEELWQAIHANTTPQPEIISVDFSTQMLIACFRGHCSSGGHGIGLEKISFDQGLLTTKMVYTAPGANCISTMALTQPYLIVAIDKVDVTDTKFESTVRRRDCDD